MVDITTPQPRSFRPDRKLIATLTSDPQLIKYLENLGISSNSTTPEILAELLQLIINTIDLAALAQGTAGLASAHADRLEEAMALLDIPRLNEQSLSTFLQELETRILDLSGRGISSVSVTAPINSTGNQNPTIGIDPATPSSAGSLSAADKTRLDGLSAASSPTFVALTLTNGQIVFPATQVPSANPNTLDDYEEGTWTPVVTFAVPGDVSVAYTTRIGTYTKIGRLIHCKLVIVTSTFTHTTSSGGFNVTGFPFAPPASGAQGVPSGGVLYSGFNLGATVCGVIGRLDTAGIAALMGMTTGSPGAFTDLTSTNHTTATNINLYLTFNYEVA